MSDQDNDWDFWDEAGLRCSSYSSETDYDLIRVFIKTGRPPHWYADIAALLRLDEKYVMLLMEILCSADFCEYGTSPRAAWAVRDSYQANVERLKDWYFRTWGSEFKP